MIGVAVAVAVNVLRPMRELFHIVLPQPIRIGLLRQQLIVELNVRREPTLIEPRHQRMRDNSHAALAHERHPLELHHRVRHSLVSRQYRVHPGELGITFAAVRHARNKNIRLPIYINHLLLFDRRERMRVNLSRMPAVQRDNIFGGIRVVIHRLYGKDAPPLFGERPLNQRALLPNQFLERRVLGVVNRLPACDGPGPMVMPNRAECAKSDRRRLPPAIERRPHSIQVDELVGVQNSAVHLHIKPALGIAKMDKLARILGVMAVQIVISKLQNNPPAQKRLHFCATKLAMQPLRQQQRDIA